MKAKLLRNILRINKKLEESFIGDVIFSQEDPVIERNIRKDDGLIYYWGVPQLLHCNHFNRSHQMFIEDPDYVDSEAILLRSAAEASYRQTKNYLESLENPSWDDAIEFGQFAFQDSGFGILNMDDIDRSGGIITQPYSHYSEALKLNPGERNEPGEFFDQGFAAGVILAGSEVSDMPYNEEGLTINQESSMVLGDERNKFTVSVGGDFEWLERTDPPVGYSYDKDLPKINKELYTVDVDTIMDRASDMQMESNDTGFINSFGLMLTQGYLDFYSKSLARFIDEVEEQFGTPELARDLIKEIGHYCGFFMTGKMMQSIEFEVLGGEWLEDTEDYLFILASMMHVMGWGNFRIHEFEPAEKLVIRGYNMFEAAGYRAWGEEYDENVEWVTEGGMEAFMDLLYYVDIEEIEITKEVYRDLFNRREFGFEAENKKTESSGDEYTEVVITQS